MTGKERKDKVDYKQPYLGDLHRAVKYHSERKEIGEVGKISEELNRRRKTRIESGMYPKKGPHYKLQL